MQSGLARSSTPRQPSSPHPTSRSVADLLRTADLHPRRRSTSARGACPDQLELLFEARARSRGSAQRASAASTLCEGLWSDQGMDSFEQLSVECGLLDVQKLSPGGLPERYLYSPDMLYRYAFGRWWGAQDCNRSVVWVLLNPATGDTDGKRRPTLERAIARSRGWGADGIVIVNLFAYRSTNPKTLRTAADPVGPHNNRALTLFSSTALKTVAAWGAMGGLHQRSSQVRQHLVEPLCLGTTAKGEPRHPLYVPAHQPPVPLA